MAEHVGALTGYLSADPRELNRTSMVVKHDGVYFPSEIYPGFGIKPFSEAPKVTLPAFPHQRRLPVLLTETLRFASGIEMLQDPTHQPLEALRTRREPSRRTWKRRSCTNSAQRCGAS